MTKFPAILAFAAALGLSAHGQMLPSAPKSASPTTPAADTPSPAVATVSAPAGNLSPSYVIGAGDSLSVSVWKEPTISGPVPVRPDGMISLQLIGDIQAAGRTPTRLGEEITQRLKKYITEPVVTVAVLGVNSKQIFTLGEIGKPGALALLPGMTPLQAIATAGGLTLYAHPTKIYILRTGGQKVPFNYKKAVKDGNLQGVALLPGDTIVVP